MPTEDLPTIAALIVTVRGQRVLLATDLARVYGVSTKVLNQAVKRNARRFPEDFAFKLTRLEAEALERSRSQAVTLKRGRNLKYAPVAFTEHGAIMAATVLRSPRAVQMSLFVVRAFVSLRIWVASHQDVVDKLAELEERVGAHDADLQTILRSLRELMHPPERERKQVGFLGPPERSLSSR
ncbi:MAG: ORF6N domain-containing protein [Planctomycetota bacterium]